MNAPNISDIPSIQKRLSEIDDLKALRQAMHVLHPVLRTMGIDVEKMTETFLAIEELDRLAQELAAIPDRFNDLFSSRGWIIHDRMSLDIAKSAINLAESGDMTSAEAKLVEYYSAENLKFMLLSMNKVAAFHPRMPLAQKALMDYEEGRYYSSVLVTLSLLDGLVNDLHQPKQGFFSVDVNLEAWDSIAAHSKGLQSLTNILQKGRYKTTAENITIPYRNGIMHGTDLGYDNKIVAAKSWAALIAAREWAIKAESGTLTASQDESEDTWQKTVQQWTETADESERLAQWVPRNIEVDKHFPATGLPNDYGDNTPEQKLAEYLGYWKQRNYGYMAGCLSQHEGESQRKLAGHIKKIYMSMVLTSFTFVQIIDVAAAVTEIQTVLNYEANGQPMELTYKFKLFSEDSEKLGVVRSNPRAKWVVVNWMIDSSLDV